MNFLSSLVATKNLLYGNFLEASEHFFNTFSKVSKSWFFAFQIIESIILSFDCRFASEWARARLVYRNWRSFQGILFSNLMKNYLKAITNKKTKQTIRRPFYLELLKWKIENFLKFQNHHFFPKFLHHCSHLWGRACGGPPKSHASASVAPIESNFS